VLGLAVGGAAFSPNSDTGNFGIGALIWSALSVLISFFVGGWMASRASALRGRSAGILNGAMVWFVAIPLLLYVLTSSVSSLLGTAGSVLGTAAQTATTAGAAAADDATALTDAVQQAAPDLSAEQVQGIVTNLQNQATQAVTDPQNQEAVANAVSANAWRTLLGLGLAAAAAILGGIAGSGRKDEIDQRLTA
jgi:DNA uptake protein ComE-like DNA-binding protein